MNGTQRYLVNYIYENEGKSQVELCNALQMSSGQISTLIKGLETEGYIRRIMSERMHKKIKQVYLTEVAKKLMFGNGNETYLINREKEISKKAEEFIRERIISKFKKSDTVSIQRNSIRSEVLQYIIDNRNKYRHIFRINETKNYVVFNVSLFTTDGNLQDWQQQGVDILNDHNNTSKLDSIKKLGIEMYKKGYKRGYVTDYLISQNKDIPASQINIMMKDTVYDENIIRAVHDVNRKHEMQNMRTKVLGILNENDFKVSFSELYNFDCKMKKEENLKKVLDKQ